MKKCVVALAIALILGGCGPTCIRAGGWGMNLEICWEGEQPSTVKNMEDSNEGDSREEPE